jgi:manganese transport protein
MHNIKEKLKRLLLSLLPGIFLIGYTIGTGSVTAMAKSGANFGLDLIWAVLLSCMITYYLIDLFSRYTMTSGKTFIQGVKENIHPTVGIILLIALSVIIISALIGILGIISEVLQIWSTSLINYTIPKSIWAIIVGLAIYILIWNGNISFFQKVLAVLVAIMGVAFFVTALINLPSIKDLFRSLIPTIPDSAVGSDNSPFVIIAGLVGTTVSVFVFIIRSQMIKETGWTLKEIRVQRRDAIFSATLMFVISASIVITAATTLHIQGIKLNNVFEMIPLLEPIAGPAALHFFVIGILAAGLSSQLPNMLVIPWLIIDYRKDARETLKSTFHRTVLFVLTLTSVVGVAAGIQPVFIMMISQASLSIVLPLTIIAIIYLTTRKSIMKDNVNKFLDNFILLFVLLFALYMSWLGINGLIVDLVSMKSI